MDCPLCGEKAPAAAFHGIQDLEYRTYRPVDYARCGSCGLIFQSPVPPAELLAAFYPEDYRNYLPVKEGLLSFMKRLQFKLLAARLAKRFGRDSKFLEIGCGNGQLLLALKRLGWKKLYGSDLARRAFPELEGAGIKLKAGDVEREFPFDEAFDVIFMNNVIEHFADPFEVLARCRARLSEAGNVVLITPNGGALELGLFGKFWAGFHAPRHTFLFNEKNIRLLGRKLGFSGVEIEPLADPGQWSISVQNMLQSRPATRTRLKNGLAWYLPALTPAFMPACFLQNLLGKSSSLLCVLEAKGSTGQKIPLPVDRRGGRQEE